MKSRRVVSTLVLLVALVTVFGTMESMGQAPTHHPVLRSSFDAIDFSADSAYNGGIIHIEPNPSMGAARRHLVCTVSSSIGIYTKDGSLQRGTSLADFFSPLQPLRDPLEPKVIYDQFSSRFLVMAIDRSDTLLGDSANTSRILLAVSVTDNPIAGWWFTEINSRLMVGGLEMAAEYPDLAVTSEDVYVTVNLLSFSHPRVCGGLRLCIMDKGGNGGFYDGGPAQYNMYAPYSDTVVTEIPRHRLAKMFGTPRFPFGEMYLVSYLPGQKLASDRLTVTSIQTRSQGDPTFISKGVYIGKLDDIPGLPDAPQPGTTRGMSAFGKFVYDAAWRSEILYVTTTILPFVGADSGQATAQWIAVNTDGGVSGDVSGRGFVGGEDIAAGTYTYYPSISVDPSNNLAIGFGASGPDLCPGAYFTAGLASDSTATYGGSGVLRQGLDYYNRSLEPADPDAPSGWGRYSTTCVDPTDGSFWFYNAYAGWRGTPDPIGSDGRWRTAVGHFYPSDWTDVRGENLPVGISLMQNYPNPFNPSTTIRYGLPGRSYVTLTVFNTLGQQVATLVDGEVQAGYYGVKFDASHLPSGVYLYRLQAGVRIQARKALLMK